jgi:hypothetical protein
MQPCTVTCRTWLLLGTRLCNGISKCRFCQTQLLKGRPLHSFTLHEPHFGSLRDILLLNVGAEARSPCGTSPPLVLAAQQLNRADSANARTRTVGVYSFHEARPASTSHKERSAPVSHRHVVWRGISDCRGLRPAIHRRFRPCKPRWSGTEFILDLVWLVFIAIGVLWRPKTR